MFSAEFSFNLLQFAYESPPQPTLEMRASAPLRKVLSFSESGDVALLKALLFDLNKTRFPSNAALQASRKSSAALHKVLIRLQTP